MSKTPGVSERRALRRLLAGRWGSVAWLAGSSVLGGLAEASFLVLVTRAGFAVSGSDRAVDGVFGQQLSVGEASLLALALILIRVLLAAAGAALGSRIAARTVATVRSDLASGFLRSSWTVQQGERSGRLQELLTSFTQRASELVAYVVNAVSASFSLIALLLLAVAVDPAGAAVVIAAVAVLGSILRPIRRAVRRSASRSAKAGMEFASKLSEISELGMEMHVFDVEGPIEREVHGLIEENALLNDRLGFLRGIVPVLYTGMAYLAIVGAIALVSMAGSADITSVGAVMLVMLRSLSYGQGLQSALASIAATQPSVEALHDQLDLYAANRLARSGAEIGSVEVMEVRELDFHYVPGVPALRCVNLTFRRGAVTGIVGPSGGGKSTLVQLLLGLRAPVGGGVFLDGRPLEAIDRTSFAQAVTLVPQSARLVAGTIEENIRFFRPHVSHEAIVSAAKKAHLHEDIAAWKDLYHHQVGEKGGNLSGGQQQRLCIARALVDSPSVLILDEPTSSLDLRSERLVLQTLSELSKSMIVIVVAHRMAVLEICDDVVVIQDGAVVGSGPRGELSRSNEFFREAVRLASAQSQSREG